MYLAEHTLETFGSKHTLIPGIPKSETLRYSLGENESEITICPHFLPLFRIYYQVVVVFLGILYSTGHLLCSKKARNMKKAG